MNHVDIKYLSVSFNRYQMSFHFQCFIRNLHTQIWFFKMLLSSSKNFRLKSNIIESKLIKTKHFRAKAINIHICELNVLQFKSTSPLILQLWSIFFRYLDREFLKAYSVVECRSIGSLHYGNSALLITTLAILIKSIFT